jgi:ATP adenylyltransferase
VFCTAHASQDDARNLILYRGDSTFVMMNLYPYNTGHLMVIPNEHEDDLSRLRPETRAELAELTASFCNELRLALRCEGFNTGMNLGSVAGAGIADHLHQHIVPRWQGDANFMPIVGSTKVLPELIPATYAKLRADIAGQKSGANAIAIVPISPDGAKIALLDGGLPRVEVQAGASAWASATAHLRSWFASFSLIGWAGPASTDEDTTAVPTLAISATPRPVTESIRLLPVATALETLTGEDHGTLAACVERGYAAVGQRE